MTHVWQNASESGSSCARRRARLPRLPKRWSPSQSPRNRCRGNRRRTASPPDSRESLVEVADRGPLGGCLLGRAPQLRRGSLDSHGLGRAIPPPRVHAACEVALSLTVRDDVSKAIPPRSRLGAPHRRCTERRYPPFGIAHELQRPQRYCSRVGVRDRTGTGVSPSTVGVLPCVEPVRSATRLFAIAGVPQGSRSQGGRVAVPPGEGVRVGCLAGDAASDR